MNNWHSYIANALQREKTTMPNNWTQAKALAAFWLAYIVILAIVFGFVV